MLCYVALNSLFCAREKKTKTYIYNFVQGLQKSELTNKIQARICDLFLFYFVFTKIILLRSLCHLFEQIAHWNFLIQIGFVWKTAKRNHQLFQSIQDRKTEGTESIPTSNDAKTTTALRHVHRNYLKCIKLSSLPCKKNTNVSRFWRLDKMQWHVFNTITKLYS